MIRPIQARANLIFDIALLLTRVVKSKARKDFSKSIILHLTTELKRDILFVDNYNSAAISGKARAGQQRGPAEGEQSAGHRRRGQRT
jgi:hypothetical protein